MGDRVEIDFESDLKEGLPDFESDLIKGGLPDFESDLTDFIKEPPWWLRKPKNLGARIADEIKTPKKESKPPDWMGLNQLLEKQYEQKLNANLTPDEVKQIKEIDKLTHEEADRVLSGEMPLPKDGLGYVRDPKMRVALQTAINGEEEKSRMLNAERLSMITGTDITGYHAGVQDSLIHTWVGEDEKVPNTTIEERFYLQAQHQIDVRNLMDLYMKKYLGDSSDELQAKIEDKESKLTPTDPYQGSFLETAWKGTLDQIFGIYWKSAENAGWMGLGLGVLGAGFGLLTGGPAGAVVMGKGALAFGMEWGRRKGFAEYEVASAYRDFLNKKDAEGNKLDPGFARIAATTVGLANAFIEEWQWMTAFKGAPSQAGISQAVHKGMLKWLTSSELMKFSSKFFMKKAVQKGLETGGKFAVTVVQEMGEEEIQTLQTMAQENIYSMLHNAFKGTKFPEGRTFKEVADAAWDTAKQSIGPILLMSAAGMVTQEVKGKLAQEVTTGAKPTTEAQDVRALRERSRALDEIYKGYVPGTKIEPTTEGKAKIAEEIETVTKEEEAAKTEIPAVTEKVKISTEEEFTGASKLILGEANSPTMQFVYGAEKQIGETKDAYTYTTPKGELRGRVHNFDIVKWEKEDGTIRYLIHAKDQKGNQYSRPEAAAQFVIEDGKPKLLTIASAEKRIGLGTRLLQEIEKDYGEMFFSEPVSKSGAALLHNYLGENWEERAIGEKVPVETIAEEAELPAEEVIETVPEEAISEEEFSSILDEWDVMVSEEETKAVEGEPEVDEKRLRQIGNLSLEAARIDTRIREIKGDTRFDAESRRNLVREHEQHREDIYRTLSSMIGMETGPATEQEFTREVVTNGLAGLWQSGQLSKKGHVRLPSPLYFIAKGVGLRGAIKDTWYNTAMRYIKASPNQYRFLFSQLSEEVSPEMAAAFGGGEMIFVGDQEYENTMEKGVAEEISEEEVAELDKAETDEETGAVLQKDFESKQAELIGDIANVKQRIRALTGQRKVGNERVGETYDEYKALKDQFKKEQKVSRAGLLEGIRSGKQAVRDMWKKYRENRAKREYIGKLTKVIMQKLGGNIDPGYVEAIENLRAGIDPHFRAESTIEKRARTEQFMKDNPDLAERIPKKLRDTVGSKPLNDYTLDELETLAHEVGRLKDQGKLKHGIRKRLKRNIDDNLMSRVIDSITGGQELVVEGPEQHDIKKIQEAANVVRTEIYLHTLGWQRVFDVVDGGKKFKGAVHELLYGGATEIKKSYLKEYYQRIGAFQEKVKETGLNMKDFGKHKTTVKGIKFNTDQAMDVYNKMKNEKSFIALQFGNKLSETQMEQIVSTLTDKEKALADWIVEEYDQWYPEQRQHEINENNRDPGYEKSYTEMRRMNVDHVDLTFEMADEMAMRQAFKRAYPYKGFLIKRQNIPKRYQQPIQLGSVTGWLNTMQKQAYLKASEGTIKQMHYVVHNKTFTDALRVRFGDKARPIIKMLHTYVNQIARNKAFEDRNILDRVSRWAQKNTAVVYLAWSIKTALTQGPSLAFYAPYTGVGRLISSAMQMGRNWTANTQKIYELDPEMRSRSIEQELEDLKAGDLSLYKKLRDKFGQKGMWGIMFMDRLAVNTGWWAVYNKGLAEGMTEKEAAREAHDVTLRTQPAFDIKDRAQMYNLSRTANLFMQFSQQLNQNWNMMVHDMPMYLKHGDWKKGLGIIAAWTLSAQVMWMLSHRRPPEDLEDLANAEKDAFLAMIPFFGRALLSASDGFEGGSLPIIEGSLNVAKGGVQLFTRGKVSDQTLEGLALMTRIPFTGPKRLIKALQTGEIMNLIGGKPRR